ncbi:MAG: undecaprenyl-diphosphate phosphatase [Clostridia bacterium]|nr:undecaprenyl-diphosphate phosphatase [Clostridia bacterium]
MNFWILLLLAIVQGITEFLPISSSGHTVLLNNIFGINNNIKLLSILLHIATLLSVLVFYRKELITLLKHPLCNTNKKIITTTIFTCLIVLILRPLINKTFDGNYIFVFFIITAFLLFIGDYMADKRDFLSNNETCKTNANTFKQYDITNIPITYKQSIIIGITQGIACIPGISRSGSTIAIGQICGAKDTARYSFLISIPIIIASFVLELFDGGLSNISIPTTSLIISMIVCFAIGLVCIKYMTILVRKNKMALFGYYLLAISTILVILSFF